MLVRSLDYFVHKSHCLIVFVILQLLLSNVLNTDWLIQTFKNVQPGKEKILPFRASNKGVQKTGKKR